MPFLFIGDPVYSCTVDQGVFECAGGFGTYTGAAISSTQFAWVSDSFLPSYVCTVGSGTSTCTTGDFGWPDYVCTNLGGATFCDASGSDWSDYSCIFLDSLTVTCLSDENPFPPFPVFSCVFSGTASSGDIECFISAGYSCWYFDPGITIPDNDPTGVSSSVTTSTSDTIADLNVCVNIAHDWVGDLKVTLTHENTGTSVTIIDRPGYPASLFGCDGSNIGVFLDDEALATAEDSCSQTGTAVFGFRIPNGALSAFDGESISGTWTLTVTDEEDSIQGELLGWQIWYVPQ